MNVASLELCKELYELSGWDDTDFLHDSDGSLYEAVVPVGHSLASVSKNVESFPAYDLGYLLRKLPPQIRLPYKNGRLRKHPNFLSLRPDRDYGGGYVYKPGWGAIYLKYKANDYVDASADTPEDAACKLAIELFKRGILPTNKSEGENT